MDELNNLLNSFGRDGYVSPEDLKAVCDAVKLLAAKVAELQAQIDSNTSV